MKSTHLYIGRSVVSIAALTAICALAGGGCSKSIPSSESLTAYTASGTDSGAGAWSYIILSGPTQIPVAAPVPTSDPTYVAELQAIENAQATLTTDQKTAISYWSDGGVLRWNEELRQLVSRQDLPPAPNADGSYPSPNPANPFANPQYPFSNPPYAARAYSYVSVAQYEALKVVWYYKFKYNRAAPFNNDTKIKALMPDNHIPSFPSEDAVEAGVNDVMLKLLFPTSAVEIDALAAQQQQAALLAGRATASDIAAGLAIGQAVAAVLSNRAANDGFKAAGGNATIWAQLAATQAAKGEIPWVSQDGPPRPPMLPVFGSVQAWMLKPTDILNERAPAPPSTHSAAMAADTQAVRDAVTNITPDQMATVYKWADGVSTPTPPGHWNYIAVPYITAAKQSDVRAARTFALLDMALHDAAVSCWDTKYFYFNPRPTQLDETIKTWTGLPNFPSYVSGHSDFSAAAADVLSYLFPDGASYFAGQAQEAAMSRLYGGLHYPRDITVGLVQGKSVAEYTVRFAKADGAN
jgi:membrane-associated phospholipid phosphatase